MGSKNSITLNKKPLNKKPLNNGIPPLNKNNGISLLNNGISPLNKKPLNNIQQLFNNKKQLFNNKKQHTVIRGGVLEDSDIEKINELITDKLVHFGLIPAIEPAAIDTGAKKSSTVEPVIDAAIEAAMAASIKVNNTGHVPGAVFAKSTIPLAPKISKKEMSILKQQGKELSSLGSSDVYFHMVKITEENVIEWRQFEDKIKEISPVPGTLININYSIDMPRHNTTINMNAGLNHFKIRESNTFSDLFVVYASKELNKTNFPPDWKDVEIMVTVLARENVPFVTQMGIVRLAHTYTKAAFAKVIDFSTDTINTFFNHRELNQELYDYLKLINFNYPSHSHMSLYLFTFIGTYIYQFFSTKKTALFTSPTQDISNIVINTLKKYELPYGYEYKQNFRMHDPYIIKLNLSNDAYQFLNLSRDNLKELCPWYCNLFYTIRVQTSFPGESDYDTEDESVNFRAKMPEDTDDCYIGPESSSPFLYVPIYTFNQLVERGIYQFEAIE